MQKSTNADAVTHFDLFHSLPLRKVYYSAILNYALLKVHAQSEFGTHGEGINV